MVWRSAVQSGWVTGDGWGSSEDPLILRVKTNTWTPGSRGLLDLLFSSLLCSSTLTPSDAIWFGLPPLYVAPYLPIGLETVAYCSSIRSSQQDPVPSLFRLCFPIVSRIHLARRRTLPSPSFFTVHISSHRSRLDTPLTRFHRSLPLFHAYTQILSEDVCGAHCSARFGFSFSLGIEISSFPAISTSPRTRGLGTIPNQISGVCGSSTSQGPLLTPGTMMSSGPTRVGTRILRSVLDNEFGTLPLLSLRGQDCERVPSPVCQALG